MHQLYCDRCGAMSKTRWLFPDGTDLVFCGHHTREYAPGLNNSQALEDPEFQSLDNPALIGA